MIPQKSRISLHLVELKLERTRNDISIENLKGLYNTEFSNKTKLLDKK